MLATATAASIQPDGVLERNGKRILPPGQGCDVLELLGQFASAVGVRDDRDHVDAVVTFQQVSFREVARVLDTLDRLRTRRTDREIQIGQKHVVPLVCGDHEQVLMSDLTMPPDDSPSSMRYSPVPSSRYSCKPLDDRSNTNGFSAEQGNWYATAADCGCSAALACCGERLAVALGLMVVLTTAGTVVTGSTGKWIDLTGSSLFQFLAKLR
uniref:Uncharacterized protein n=1 Tax=Anopheles merus TaxID=30066 RepID=A0A182UU73_ANOME